MGEFEVGGIVQLKSGGPKVTVSSMDGTALLSDSARFSARASNSQVESTEFRSWRVRDSLPEGGDLR